MGGINFRKLKIQGINYTEGALKTQELPKSIFRFLRLTLKVTHTNGVSPVITAESLCRLISKLGIIHNGRDTQITFPFWALELYNYYNILQDPQQTFFTTDSTQGESTISLKLPFSMPRTVKPNDTIADFRKILKTILSLNWGSSIGTNVASIDSATLEIDTGEYQDITYAKDEVGGRGRHEISLITHDITAAGERELPLDVGQGNQYRGVYIVTRDNAGALSNDIIDNIALVNRNFTFVDVSTESIQDDNADELRITPRTGVYYLDFITDGKLTKRLNAEHLDELLIKYNSLVSDGTIEVIQDKAIFKTGS